MLHTTKVLPPTVAPPTRPLSILQSIRAARRNVLELVPELAYGQPMVSGRMGARWHMVQDPGALRRVLLDNVENYPKSEVMLRMLRPAVGKLIPRWPQTLTVFFKKPIDQLPHSLIKIFHKRRRIAPNNRSDLV